MNHIFIYLLVHLVSAVSAPAKICLEFHVYMERLSNWIEWKLSLKPRFLFFTENNMICKTYVSWNNNLSPAQTLNYFLNNHIFLKHILYNFYLFSLSNPSLIMGKIQRCCNTETITDWYNNLSHSNSPGPAFRH